MISVYNTCILLGILLLVSGCAQYNFSGWEDTGTNIQTYVSRDVNISSNVNVEQNLSIDGDILSNEQMGIVLGAK